MDTSPQNTHIHVHVVDVHMIVELKLLIVTMHTTHKGSLTSIRELTSCAFSTFANVHVYSHAHVDMYCTCLHNTA